MLSRVMRVIAVCRSFLWLNNIPLGGKTTLRPVHQLRGIWVVPTLATMNNASINICTQVLCGHMFLFLLVICIGMELLGHVGTPGLAF